jgi:ribose transport system permease protein
MSNAFETRIRRKEMTRGFLERFGILLVCLIMFGAFSLLSSKFGSANNIFNIFKQVSHIAVLSIGMTFVFLIGGMDLSAGSNIFLGAVTVAALLEGGIVTSFPAMLIAILLCTMMGMLNGLIIEGLHINCVIVTLGSQLVIRGVALLIIANYNQWIYVKDPTVNYINTGAIAGLPVLIPIMAVLYAIAYFVLHKSNYGRKVYAVGGNEKAAWLCGLNPSRVKALCYMVSGLCAGIAGVIIASRLGMVNTTVGDGMEFDAVAAVVLGGCSLKGGEGSVLKTFIGAFIVGMIANFMTLFGVNEHFQDAVMGGFILLAALFNRVTQQDIG